MRRTPHVSFKRRPHGGACAYEVRSWAGGAWRVLGVTLTTDADVSFVPDAEGESVGFRDARIEKVSDSKELNFLLEPFLSHKLPARR